jgi:subtilisin family serine protease
VKLPGRNRPGAGGADAYAATVRGAGVTVAVIDDAVDTRHPEFVGRLAAGWDAETKSDSPLPRGWQPHGTKVAGLILAGGIRVRGVAPEATLMGIRAPIATAGVGDASDAEAVRWATKHGADVICCAWGPSRPATEAAMQGGQLGTALDWAVGRGRDGRGCVIVFSSGNDGSDIASNSYASHPDVIAVGACNVHDKHPSYSGWGSALWCVFPSNDPRDPDGAAASYLSTAPVGSFLIGDTFYTRFGFTSAACAAVAGICALILSANPGLTSREVKDVLARSCRKIDASGGSYDGNGHSPLYGFGRPDPLRAVKLARENSRSASV